MQTKQVLDDLLKSDRETNGRPVLPEENREMILKVLARAIVDDNAREEYRGAVLHQARHSGGATPSMCADVLSDERTDDVLTGGLNTLKNAELARLALCPPEIAGLAHVFLEVLSNPDPEVQARYNRLDAWQEALRERLLSRPSGRLAWEGLQTSIAGRKVMVPPPMEGQDNPDHSLTWQEQTAGESSESAASQPRQEVKSWLVLAALKVRWYLQAPGGQFSTWVGPYWPLPCSSAWASSLGINYRIAAAWRFW